MSRLSRFVICSLSCALLSIAAFNPANAHDDAKDSHHHSHDHAKAEAKFYPRAGGPANLPFSEAVQVGQMLYLSGEIGIDSTGKLAAGGMKAEARQVMDNIGATLKRYGSSFDQVIQCTVALADIKDWPDFNEIYRPYFRDHFPARMAYATSALALGARVEVQCNAVVD